MRGSHKNEIEKEWMVVVRQRCGTYTVFVSFRGMYTSLSRTVIMIFFLSRH